MSELNEVDSMSSELESRLDDLFNENDIRLPDSPEQDSKAHYPLAELKSLILSIDWEITDEVLENLLQQLKDLKIMYQHDKIVLAFLQILNSLGDYIKTNRGKSHPKTFKILNSVFSSLDQVVLSRDMAETVKKKILLTEINRYKKLRAHIVHRKGTPQQKATTVSAKTETPRIEKTEAPQVTVAVPTVPTPEAIKDKAPVADTAEAPRPERIEAPQVMPPEPTVSTPEAIKGKAPVADTAETPKPERTEGPQVTPPEPAVPMPAATEDLAPVADTAEAPRIERTEAPEVTPLETSVSTPEATQDITPVVDKTEAPRIERIEEPASATPEASSPTPVAPKGKAPVAEQIREPSVETLPEPSIATLSAAVQEIKQYIHSEIKALKEELESLRDRK